MKTQNTKIFGIANLIGLALALSPATQTRFANGVGIGEVVLIFSSLICIVTILNRGSLKSIKGVNFYFLVVFVCLFTSLLSVLSGYSQGTISEQWIRQYFFVGIVVIYPILVDITYGFKIVALAVSSFALITVITNSIFIVLFFINQTQIFGIDTLYDSLRYQGFSENPNQCAFALAIAVPIFANDVLRGRYAALYGIPLVALGAAAGLATSSNSLQLCWILSSSGVLFDFRSEGNHTKSAYNSVRNNFAVVFKLLVIIGIPVSLGWVGLNWESIYQGNNNNTGDDTDGAVRILLWINAMDAWLASFMLGHGPGHYSGIPNPFAGTEAHNTFLDFADAYGVLGISSLIFLCISNLTKLIRDKNYFLFSVIVAVVLFSCFHFLGRNPIYWFLLWFGSRSLKNRFVREVA